MAIEEMISKRIETTQRDQQAIHRNVAGKVHLGKKPQEIRLQQCTQQTQPEQPRRLHVVLGGESEQSQGSEGKERFGGQSSTTVFMLNP